MATRKRPGAKKKGGAKPAPAVPAPDPSLTPSQQAQRDAGFAALKRQMNGEQLSAGEINALRKYERQTERSKLQEAYRRCAGEDLRGLIGCSRMQLTRFQTYGAPRNEDGSYSLAQFLPWLLEHERARIRKEGEKAVDALEVYRQARAEEAQLSMARRRGEVLSAALVESEEERAGRVVSEELLAWGNRLAPRLAGLEPRAVQAILVDESRRVLDRLSAAVSTAQAKGRQRGRAS